MDLNMDFSIRTNKAELLDQPGIPAADIRLNMAELAIINNKLGGHQITWAGFSQLAKKGTAVDVCEIGCGGGDNLKAIENKAGKKYAHLSLTGIDINPDCIEVAEKNVWKNPCRLIVSDYQKYHFSSKPDIIFCSLFCHHFPENELVHMFRWMQQNCRSGFFINDLHRHPLAYHSIRWLTTVFSKSYLVKHDAPLSVLRGFKKSELKEILRRAGISNFSIRWKWAFRWLIIVHN